MFKSTLIVGCGLIGSSILRAINSKKLSKEIIVVEKSKKNFSKLKKLKIKYKLLKKLNNKVSNVDFVIICTPMSEYKKIIFKLNKYIKPNCLITDVGSTKKNIKTLKRKYLKKDLSWISSHPIAGAEKSGPDYGNKNLFLNKWCIIIQEKKNNLKKLNQLIKFWNKMGSKIVKMDIENHDKIFAITSHLPHLIAYNLIRTAQDTQKFHKKNIIKYSAGGLRDFSRIAASNEIMWRDIFFHNQSNMIKGINLFIKNLNQFKKNIQRKENKKILNKLVNSKKVRKEILQLKQDIDKPNFGRD
tara:strand:+ start:1927 stop:2826 length:900 start_codon:yes stop_codon:yes gene_type:complete